MRKNNIIITLGEPAGIGPDILIQIAQKNWPIKLVVCADAVLLQERAALLNLPLKLIPYNASYKNISQKAGTITLLPISLRAPVVPGKLCVANSSYVLETITRACNGCLNGEFGALVTGPVHKGIMHEANIPFIGHTDFFEKHSNSLKSVMMLVTEYMRVALVTTHLPIKAVSEAITTELLRNVITVLFRDLQIKFNISHPHILVCGLNPHAGENGYIGTEETNIIIPVLNELRAKGMKLSGPLPADTIFQAKYLNYADVILTMYHDQGLPVLKYHGFGRSVNVTLGLPFIRTSVDHGTALDIAGKGKADINSFIAAINLAIKMIVNTK